MFDIITNYSDSLFQLLKAVINKNCTFLFTAKQWPYLASYISYGQLSEKF